MAVASESYAPSVLVSTEGLPEKDWLEYRRRGIGGSDAAAILGISPFATARDLYYDKLKIVPFDDSESNWVAKKMGHLLEDLVAEIFHVKTGYRIYQIKKMFYHPVHTFMLADIDYFVELPKGRTAILEIKTTNYNAKDHWWSEDGQEIVPLNYEAQGRHYMSVMNIDEVFYCCLYGNNEDEVIIRHIDRDRDYEAELIALEQDFWENHILTGMPPPYTEDGDLILDSVRHHFGPADPSAPELILEGNMALLIPRYLELQTQRNAEKRNYEHIEAEMRRLQGRIARLLCRPVERVDVQDLLTRVRRQLGVELSLRQTEAVHMAFRSDLSIITGSPGTGKTTVLKAVIEVFKLLKPSEKILLAAPTGRASRRMVESTGVDNASTLHSLLGLYGEEGAFRKNEEEGALNAGLIIVDESSMMDMRLAQKFFSRIGPDTKVLLVGDADQLQSVGAGNVFRELINCGLIPVTVLNEIFRQKKNSLIAYNAQKINNNDTSFFYGNDFTVCKCANQEEAAEHIRNIYLAQVKQYGVDRVQILSPFRSTGAASVDQLNEAIRELVNPQTEEADLKVGSLYFRVGDKVMQNRNSGKASNGDIGFIRSFRHDERDGMRIAIQFSPTRVVEYSMEEMGHVELAYATTVHKAQGSEFDVVIFPLLRSHVRMLTRSLVYTAITRAKVKVILVGQIGMLYMAVHKDDTGKRNTQLGRRIALYVNTFKVQKRSA